MHVWFLTRDRHACLPQRLSPPKPARVLIALMLGLALLAGQRLSPDHTVAANAIADSRAQEGCLEDGSGSLKVELSGALEHDIHWANDDMECGGMRGTVQFGGVPSGATEQVDLNFTIDAEEGATGTGLPVRVTIYDRASRSNFAMSGYGCAANVTEQSVIEENPAFRMYRVAANGTCSEPLKQLSGPGAGTGEVTVGSFEFVGLAFWQ